MHNLPVPQSFKIRATWRKEGNEYFEPQDFLYVDMLVRVLRDRIEHGGLVECHISVERGEYQL